VSCTFTLKLPTHRVDAAEEFLSATAIAELARAAEELGYAAISVTDHPFPGVEWLESGGHHTLDPFATLAVAAAATSTIKLQTALLVLPYRHPFIVAKMAATLDVISAGRLVLGVGAGYAAGEFAALDADFVDRNAVTDRAICSIKRAWRAESVPISGGDPMGHTMRPMPTQQPHPPILVGGNSRIAMVRAARHASGWLPMFNPANLSARRRSGQIGSTAELATKITELNAIASDVGRTDRLKVHYSTPKLSFYGLSADPGRLRSEAQSLADIGVDAISVDLPGDQRSDWLRGAQRLAHSWA
jgi:probable F420-dependent oxidoreductase